MVSVKARMERGETQIGFQPPQVLGRLARPGAVLDRAASLHTVAMGPQATAQAIESTREVANQADTSLEMMDIEALDTGRYQAMVI